MTKSDFDAADLNLIARCQKAKGTIPQLARGVRFLFWGMLAAKVLYTLTLFCIWISKGPAALPTEYQQHLAIGWLWIGAWFLATRSLKFEAQAVKLICKMTEE